MTRVQFFLLPVAVWCLQIGEWSGAAADWVRAGVNTNRPIWGLRGGLQFAIPPGGFGGGDGGPRGLIRLGYPTLTNGGYALINFIAIEPVVAGRRGFSELETSRLDGAAGKRFWIGVDNAEPQSASSLNPGRLTSPASGVEQLELTLRVEKFDNGAHVYVVLAQRSDAPDELRLTLHREPDSAPIEQGILTATMGNMARTRRLWLRDAVVTSQELYPHHRGDGFAAPTVFPLARLTRTASGDVLVAVTTDEAEPAAVFPFPGSRRWYYAGMPVTQYWRKPADELHGDLQAAVNARFTYWMSQQPIPGGVAFENFELREPFRDGQTVVFGITRKTPAELGVTGRPSPPRP